MPRSLPANVSDPTDREEGNAAHWAAQQLFNGVDLVEGQFAPNGYAVTGEMLDHVQTYLSALDCGEMEAETSFGTDHYRVNARCDHRKYRADMRHLFIDDFKYGWRIVPVENNWTLIAHAIGTVQFLPEPPLLITFGIHQPRPHHPDGKHRTWTIDYNHLQQLWTELHNVLTNPTDMLQTGPQCAKCPALATCPAARSASMNAIDATALAFSDDLPNDVLSHELDVLRNAQATLENRLSAIEELTKHRLRAGQIIDNYALSQEYGHMRWKSGLNAEGLKLASGIDLSKPGLVTPAEAKRRGVPETVVKALTERPTTGIKLIRQSIDERAKKLLSTRSK